MSKNNKPSAKLVGLIPAAGLGERISPLPGSKELYPVGFQAMKNGNGARPKVIAHYLLEKMKTAGITESYIVLRKGKWDIASYFGDGAMLGMHLAYLIMNLPYGAPYTVDQAYPFVKDAIIALGFPDIYFEENDAFSRLLSKQAESDADVVLGLFPGDHPRTMDMVAYDNSGRVSRVDVKPGETDLHHTWGLVVWTPRFTQVMHEFLIEHCARIKVAASSPLELYLGHVIQAAIEEGLRVDAVVISDTPFIDIGIPENLHRITRILASK